MGEETVNHSFVVLESIQCGVGYGLSSLCIKPALTPLITKNQVYVACVLGILI